MAPLALRAARPHTVGYVGGCDQEEGVIECPFQERVPVDARGPLRERGSGPPRTRPTRPGSLMSTFIDFDLHVQFIQDSSSRHKTLRLKFALVAWRGQLSVFFFFFFTLVTGPRRSLSLNLGDTQVYEP